MHDVEDRAHVAIIVGDDTPLRLCPGGKLEAGATFDCVYDHDETFTIRELLNGDFAIPETTDLATWVAAASDGALEYNPNV